MHSASVLKRDFDEISDSQDELAGTACRLEDSGGESGTPRVGMEQEKRIRREIANSNERRRMQSINAGFQTLRSLLPQHEGEKLSKAAILQQTSDFIYSLEQEKTRLLTQNCQLKRLLGQQQQQQQASDSDATSAIDSPASAHRNASRESAEAAGAAEEPAVPPPPPPAAAAEPAVSPQEAEAAVIRQELAELRSQLEQERRHRLLTEDRLRLAEAPPPPPPPAAYQERLHPGHVPLLKKPKMEVVELKPEPAEPPLAGVGGQGMEPQTVLPSLLMGETAGLQQPPPTEPPPPPPPPPAVVHPPHRQLYMGSATSRQNLDTIVEAIRHLEGDHLFEDLVPVPEPALEVEARLEEPEPQEAPLELTTHDRASAADLYRPGVIVAQHQQHHLQHHLVHQSHQHHQHHLQS